MQFKKVTLIILLFVMSAAAILVQPVQAAANVQVLTHTGEYNGVSKMFSIYGEVQNTGDVLVRTVKVEATYYNRDDQEIGIKEGNATMKYLLSGQKCPFVIQLKPEDGDTENIAGYSLTATWEASDLQRESGLQVESTSSSTVSDVIHVTGSIKNTASSPASEIWAIVTWYDSNGKVISINKDTATPRALTAGQTATFDVSWLGSSSRQAQAATYSVTADSLQYSANSKSAAIPEFSSIAVFAILLVALLALTITYKRSNKTPPV